MKAMRLFEQGPLQPDSLQMVDLPQPEPKAGQVRIKINHCGVCHTDLHIVEGDIHPPQIPLTPGHQVVGMVDKLGDGVEQVQTGQRVGVPWLYQADGICQFCQRGQENLCPNARFTGFHVDGGYAEAMLAPADYVLPLPEDIPDEQAAPLLCAGIIGYRSLHQADLQHGERLGLVGFGASAHLAIQVARHWDCEVYVFTRSDEHKRHAQELGAVWVGEAGDQPPQDLDRAVIFAPAGRLVPPILVRDVATEHGIRLERDLDGASCNSTVGTSAQASADDHKLQEFFEEVAPILTQHRGINAKSRMMMNAVAERLGLGRGRLVRLGRTSNVRGNRDLPDPLDPTPEIALIKELQPAYRARVGPND
ncbi:MAG: alcohol dehydrogenase catalytic domain-containing protein, partial [Anaerolineales bacterium]